ncbi:MAG TPA: metallophosphoesterase family protein [Burkholderiales bacterium]|nr:metallophosphoesterase family protein [Burkholderiales bacterium]
MRLPFGPVRRMMRAEPRDTMRIALIADVHSNLEALRACIADARRRGAERFVFLGDLVGYGADPVACIELAAELAPGAAVLGNHDQLALGGLCDTVNFPARDAIYWTREQLRPEHRAFLSGLPFTLRDGDALFAHAAAEAPERWTYVTDAREAERSMAATDARLVALGHVHEPMLYHAVDGGGARAFRPLPGVAVPLSPLRRWLAIVGSAGQPRDGNPAACYALLDRGHNTYTSFRVPYDHHAAARKILAAGLPERLARRLETGH